MGTGGIAVGRWMRTLARLGAGLSLAACAADPPTTDDACASDAAPPALHLAAFGGHGAERPEPATFPVWHPPQGGIVVGFDVAGRGVASHALELALRVTDAATGELLAVQILANVPFPCGSSGIRLATEQMVAVTAPVELEALYDRGVTISATAWWSATESLEATLEGTLVDEVPPDWAP